MEVDITHTDIQKNQFYASLGVPEFWRFNGRVWRIYQLQAGGYVEATHSPTFPSIEKAQLYSFLKVAKEDEIDAVRQLRQHYES